MDVPELWWRGAGPLDDETPPHPVPGYAIGRLPLRVPWRPDESHGSGATMHGANLVAYAPCRVRNSRIARIEATTSPEP